ncbi:hypothetical protein FOPE_02539 [Fonsecaea pedrosoi]|nr:hypothetical protein FOPE_02539 [Fonsecaea pedrosoi]
MRLLLRSDTGEFNLTEHFGNDTIPPYAILSHTWGADTEEVTFQDLTNGTGKDKPGYEKIRFCGEQARQDDLQYFWIDTCCIDKSSSAELTEAINSMYTWYRKSAVCYAYLSDVEHNRKETGIIDGYLESRWWTRAWTLQELIAPNHVVLFDKHWSRIGTKTELTFSISVKTGIDEDVLRDPYAIFNKSVAQRMSWASKRQAKRIEDVSYSLLGIFDLSMALIYGEGRRAFTRLQQEILKVTGDQSLFAHCFSPHTVQELRERGDPDILLPMFAESPMDFKDSGRIVSCNQYSHQTGVSVTDIGIHLRMQLVSPPDDCYLGLIPRDCWIGLIPCAYQHRPEMITGILLRRWTHDDRYRRVTPGSNVGTFLVHCKDAVDARHEDIVIDYAQSELRLMLPGRNSTIFTRSIIVKRNFTFPTWKFAGSEPNGVWDVATSTLHIVGQREPGVHCVVLAFEYEGRVLCVYVKLSISPTAITEKVELYSMSAENYTVWLALEYVLRGKQADHSRNQLAVDIQASVSSQKVFNHIITRLELAPKKRDERLEGGMQDNDGDKNQDRHLEE